MTRKKTHALAPDGWISVESVHRLRSGGNDSKGTVPIHAKPSATSRIPVYFGPIESGRQRKEN
jgi:hypothetical protein